MDKIILDNDGAELARVNKTTGRMRFNTYPITGDTSNWAMIAETTLTSAATTYTFSNLNGDVEIAYKIIFRIVNDYIG